MPIRSIQFSPDSDLLYLASDDKTVSVYDLASGELVNSFPHAGMTFSLDTR